MTRLKIGDLTLKSNIILAPMAGITDLVFRQLIRKNSDALLCTEMISSEALNQNKFNGTSDYRENQSPVSFQLSGHKPELMKEGAKKLEARADIIDLNMGCPVGKIVKNADGASLMKDLTLASAIITAVKKGVSVPVTVKCRLGWDNNSRNYLEFAKMAEDSGADAITIHGRTKSQLYSGEADWHAIAEAKQYLKIPVIANGDIVSPETAKECLEITKADGIAIGRGCLGDYKLISRVENYLNDDILLPIPNIVERLEMAKKHCELEVNYRGEDFGIKFMKKFLVWYIKGVRGGAGYREKLVRCNRLSEVLAIFDEITTAQNSIFSNRL